MSIPKNANDVMILSGARTPTGKFLGGLSSLSATDLGGVAIKAAVANAGISPETIYEVIMGQVISAGTGQAPARQAAIKADLPDNVGAHSINKACGSGLKAVMIAANGIKAGEANVYVAGGMESMSQAPHTLPRARQGLRFGDGALKDSLLQDGLWCSIQDWAMGNAAEFIARQFEVTRQEMDAFSFRSHEKAASATAKGLFSAEITPIEIAGRKGQITRIEKDEPIRATYENGSYTMTTSVERLANLPPAFEKDGQVTAGNAPGLNDGAAALVLASRAEAKRQGAQPLAKIIGYTHFAVDPQWLFSAPARAIPHLLDKISWHITDVDLFEINEAFSAQILANGVELQQKGIALDWEKVNVHGGAIALGHPVGASGGRVLVTLLNALQHRGNQRGIAALCLGGGEAVALAVEMVG